MTNDGIFLAKAKAILAELRLRQPTILSTWMVQYVAECVVALETLPRDPVIQDRCAETIARLWELQVREESRAIATGVDVFRRRAALSDDALAALRTALESPGTAAGEITTESGVTVWQLSAIEHISLEVLWASSYVQENPRDDALSDELLAEMRRETATDAQKTLGSVFPSFKTLVLDDHAAVRREVTRALRAIERLRSRILWRDQDSEENPAAEGGESDPT